MTETIVVHNTADDPNFLAMCASGEKRENINYAAEILTAQAATRDKIDICFKRLDAAEKGKSLDGDSVFAMLGGKHMDDDSKQEFKSYVHERYSGHLRSQHEKLNEFRAKVAEIPPVLLGELFYAVYNDRKLMSELHALTKNPAYSFASRSKGFFMDYHKVDGLMASLLKDVSNPAVVDDELLMHIMKNYKERLDKTMDDMKKNAEHLRERFKEVGLKAIDRGELPISKEDFLIRVNAVEFNFEDALVSGFHIGGRYRNRLVTITANIVRGLSIVRDVADARVVALEDHEVYMAFENIVFHELFHSISGDVLGIGPSHDGKFENMGSYKRGLYIISQNKFKWLNEALTETLNREFFENGIEALGTAIFRDERRALLEDLGYGTKIPKEIFRQAYFEAKMSDDGSFPAFDRLIAEIEAKCEPGILDKLEKRFAKTGIC
jgi:hypothetical protein